MADLLDIPTADRQRLGQLASSFEMELSGDFDGQSINEDIEVTPDGYIADALSRLQKVEGVTAVVVMSADGEIVRTTLDQSEASRRGLPALELQRRTQELIAASTLSRAGGTGSGSRGTAGGGISAGGSGGGGDELRSITMKTRKEEMVLVCSDDFNMLVVQKPQAA
jgi:predicted regulator of Ras-like GTPase activity (Roadblock/LC7/MglB family)